MDSGRPLCVNSRRSTANVRTRAGANRGWGPIRCTWGNNKPDRTKTQQKISQVHGYKSRPISRNLAEISIAYVIGKREAPTKANGNFDVIQLSKSDFGVNPAGVADDATQATGSANTVITDPVNHDTITLTGVSLSSLHFDASHFLLV